MTTAPDRACPSPLPAALTDAFQEHGFVRLGRTMDEAQLRQLQERIDGLMLGLVPAAGLMMQLDLGGAYGAMAEQSVGFKGPSQAYRKIEGLEHDQHFGAFLRQKCFQDWCRLLYGTRAISVYRAMFMNKPAAQGTLLPWHQDGGAIWGLDRDPLLTVWTALDDATVANGCVQVVRGSHRLGLLSAYGHTITAEQEAEHCRAQRIVELELKAGESVALHNWTLHRSDRNRTERPRRAFSVCYMDGATRTRDGASAFTQVFPAASLKA